MQYEPLLINNVDKKQIYCSLEAIYDIASRLVMNDPDLSIPITVIVPLFNREAFLPQLLNTLTSQTFTDFEVILVDDGSTDNTTQWVTDNFKDSGIRYKYLWQQNGGPYKARNSGISHAKGKYIVLFDSDDEWPDYHLAEFYNAMVDNPDIDWLFGSIKRIEHGTNWVLENSNFQTETDKTHPIISLNAKKRPLKNDTLFVIDDRTLPETMISHTLPGSMQCSIIKREVFDFHRFDESFRTTYDRFFCMKSAVQGFKFAYVKKMHLIYHVHEDNISTVGGASPDKIIKSAKTQLRGYRIIAGNSHTKAQRKAAQKRVSELHAWELAMSYQQIGLHKQAIKCFKCAVALSPTNIWMWKSMCFAYIKLFMFSIRKNNNKQF